MLTQISPCKYLIQTIVLTTIDNPIAFSELTPLVENPMPAVGFWQEWAQSQDFVICAILDRPKKFFLIITMLKPCVN